VFGEPVRVRVVVRNVSGRRVFVPARWGGTTGSILVLDVARRDVDVRAHAVTVTRRVTRALERDLDLAAGGSTEIVFSLEEAGNDAPLQGFRTFTVAGRLRPALLEVGGLRRWDAVKIAGTSLRSFRPNYDHLLDDPVRRIEQAIEKGAPVHLLTAAALVPPERRRDAVDSLVAALRGDRSIDLTIFASLEVLTEIGLGRDVEAWRAWWPRVRENYFPAARERPSPDRPGFPR
ncbi:MAG: hypothetical protein ACREID_02610, partial [Planctomycetota bacterium]